MIRTLSSFAIIFLVSVNLEILFTTDITAKIVENCGKGELIGKILFDIQSKTEDHAESFEYYSCRSDQEMKFDVSGKCWNFVTDTRNEYTNSYMVLLENQDRFKTPNSDSIRRVNYYDFEILGISMRDRGKSIVIVIEEIFESPEDFMDPESFEYYRDLYGSIWNPPETVDILVVRSRNYLQIGSVQFEWSRMNSRIKKALLNYSKSNKFKIE
jgi:hypothetical protein